MLNPIKYLPLGLLLLAVLAPPQFSQAQPRKPIVYTTPTQSVTAYLKRANQPDLPVRGQAALTITAAQLDDTLTGTFVFDLSAESRKQLAELLDQPLQTFPALLTQKGLKAVFQKETACPWLRFELNPESLEINGQQLHFNPVVLEVPESRAYLGQLICHWARQINVNRQRRGIIAAINRALNGEEDQ
jgi:hypothetical protein